MPEERGYSAHDGSEANTRRELTSAEQEALDSGLQQASAAGPLAYRQRCNVWSHFSPENSPNTSPETSPETSPKTTPDTTPDASPETSPRTSPEASPKTSPKTSPESSPKPSYSHESAKPSVLEQFANVPESEPSNTADSAAVSSPSQSPRSAIVRAEARDLEDAAEGEQLLLGAELIPWSDNDSSTQTCASQNASLSNSFVEISSTEPSIDPAITVLEVNEYEDLNQSPWIDDNQLPDDIRFASIGSEPQTTPSSPTVEQSISHIDDEIKLLGERLHAEQLAVHKLTEVNRNADLEILWLKDLLDENEKEIRERQEKIVKLQQRKSWCELLVSMSITETEIEGRWMMLGSWLGEDSLAFLLLACLFTCGNHIHKELSGPNPSTIDYSRLICLIIHFFLSKMGL